MQAGNDIKRSSPLSSAGVLSSEGLCYGILGSLRQETSALIATHRRDCVNGIYTDSLDLPHTWPSHSDTLADCHFYLRTDAQLPLVIFNEKRSSPLSSARALSSEGLVLRHSWHCAPRNLRSNYPPHRRDCVNLPLACCACTPDSHRLARPTAQTALAQ